MLKRLKHPQSPNATRPPSAKKFRGSWSAWSSATCAPRRRKTSSQRSRACEQLNCWDLQGRSVMTPMTINISCSSRHLVATVCRTHHTQSALVPNGGGNTTGFLGFCLEVDPVTETTRFVGGGATIVYARGMLGHLFPSMSRGPSPGAPPKPGGAQKMDRVHSFVCA